MCGLNHENIDFVNNFFKEFNFRNKAPINRLRSNKRSSQKLNNPVIKLKIF